MSTLKIFFNARVGVFFAITPHLETDGVSKVKKTLIRVCDPLEFHTERATASFNFLESFFVKPYQ